MTVLEYANKNMITVDRTDQASGLEKGPNVNTDKVEILERLHLNEAGETILKVTTNMRFRELSGTSSKMTDPNRW